MWVQPEPLRSDLLVKGVLDPYVEGRPLFTLPTKGCQDGSLGSRLVVGVLRPAGVAMTETVYVPGRTVTGMCPRVETNRSYLQVLRERFPSIKFS